MCDFGRTSFRRYQQLPRLGAPRIRRAGAPQPATWKEATDALYHRLRSRGEGATAILGSGFLSNEEAFLLARLADQLSTPHRSVWVDHGPARTIPNPQGGITGHDAAPNRRGVELAGLVPGEGGIDAEDLLVGEAAKACALLIIADSDFGRAAHDPKVIERLREAAFLVVIGWADTPLAQAADLVLPVAHHAEREGTFTNCENRVQRFQSAFPSPGEARPLLEVLRDLLARYEPQWSSATPATVFALLAATVPAFAGLEFAKLGASGAPLAVPAKLGASPPADAEGPRP